MSQFRIAAVTGNLHQPSRTVALAELALRALAAAVPAEVERIDLSRLAVLPAPATDRDALPAALLDALERVESADALVVATPVYRGSYTGLFKHFFDWIAVDALVDVPVVLAAAGGDLRHSLVIEHSLRPLFTFFRAHTVPTSLYATEADFTSYALIGAKLAQRAAAAASQVAQLLAQRAPRAAVAHAASAVAVQSGALTAAESAPLAAR